MTIRAPAAPRVRRVSKVLWRTCRSILGSRLARDYTLTSGGLAVARLASLGTLVLLTRALTTTQFAVYSLGWATWLLTSQMLSGVDIAYVDLQARKDTQSALLGSYWVLKLRASGWL